jgi:hypothetical protein
VVADPDSPHAAAYRGIAGRILDKLSDERREAPRIVMQ